MTAKIWIGSIAIICVAFGLAKALRPVFFIELRQRYPWVNLFDIYSFIFKSSHAEQVVRINGYLLLAIGFGLLMWVIFN